MKKPTIGINDLRTWCINNNKTSLLNEWDYNLNKCSPESYFPKSEQTVFWKCPTGLHSYPAPIFFRTTNNTGCCYCSGHKVLKGFNDFATKCPELLKEWNYEKNILSPFEFTRTSHKKVWWHCSKCSGDYESFISDRVSKHSGCPYCFGRLPILGQTDLVSWCKNNSMQFLLEDWDYSKNMKIPSDYSYGSNQVVYWKCHRCHHDWKKQIYIRTINGTGCPKCNINGTSFPEQFLYLYLTTLTQKECCNRYKKLGFELDIYIPSLQLGVEYNGSYYHSSNVQIKHDIAKKELCQANQIHLLQIYEDRDDISIPVGTDIISWKYSRDYDSIVILAQLVLQWIRTTINCSLNNSEINFHELYSEAIRYTYGTKPENSLSYKFPEIAAEWDYSRNGDITPNNISAGTHDSYYWICSVCGNSYNTKVSYRTNGSCCPKCGKQKKVASWVAGRIRRKNYYDWCIENNRQDLIDSFDTLANHKTLTEYSSGSNETVFWKCPKCNITWSTTLSNRRLSSFGAGCPVCSKERRVETNKSNKIKSGVNNLVTWCHENNRDILLEEWDYTANPLTPDKYTYGSKEKVQWICSTCHSPYIAAIKSRTSRGTNCRACCHKISST